MAARTGNWIKRLELVEKAWRVLDKYNDGSVTMEDLMEVYDVSLHPDVFAGKITEEEAILEFAKQWDHDKSGAITQNEFIDYYRGVSNSIKDDEHFEELIKAAWKLPDDDAVDDGLYGVGRSRPVTEPHPRSQQMRRRTTSSSCSGRDWRSSPVSRTWAHRRIR